ncbi:5-oxoprolinase subunit PxpB [Thalassotalea agarivorans]|uniref:Sensor histidine kinase inhibitor, KipI family n=1 Tax=Thalassotalea agarivorans TaxID=349064 RepID=A0A1I0CZ99_THASX|nr:5-oxoprolinase subunit PxpB [Thalassotalea agarivorans]SET24659.1 sensor histidine kinase inhibitor, KipI family [Thalassotalea agarivorans]
MWLKSAKGQLKVSIAGENSLIIYFGESLAQVDSVAIIETAHYLKQQLGNALVDLVPSYCSLMVTYDPLLTDHFAVSKCIAASFDDKQSTKSDERKIITLPVYYDAQVAPDLARIAEHAQLSIEQVIALHSQQSYAVYAIGFAPGFAFLGEVDERIAMARLATPRQRVPAGSVAIADRQTAVYPATSPGGWNIIGLCPTLLFDPDNSPHIPFEVGDTVTFNAISKQEFIAQGGTLPETII